MRRVKTNSHAFPALMFAQGVEQIVEEKLVRPTQYQDQELKSIQHKDEFEKPESTPFSPSKTHPVIDLVKILFGGKKKSCQS